MGSFGAAGMGRPGVELVEAVDDVAGASSSSALASLVPSAASPAHALDSSWDEEGRVAGRSRGMLSVCGWHTPTNTELNGRASHGAQCVRSQRTSRLSTIKSIDILSEYTSSSPKNKPNFWLSDWCSWNSTRLSMCVVNDSDL